MAFFIFERQEGNKRRIKMDENKFASIIHCCHSDKIFSESFLAILKSKMTIFWPKMTISMPKMTILRPFWYRRDMKVKKNILNWMKPRLLVQFMAAVKMKIFSENSMGLWPFWDPKWPFEAFLIFERQECNKQLRKMD